MSHGFSTSIVSLAFHSLKNRNENAKHIEESSKKVIEKQRTIGEKQNPNIELHKGTTARAHEDTRRRTPNSKCITNRYDTD